MKLENELIDARTAFHRAGRELAEVETSSFPLIRLGLAAEVGASIGGPYGAIIAVATVHVVESVSHQFHVSELGVAVKDAEFRIFFAEKALKAFDETAVDMPPVWNKDP